MSIKKKIQYSIITLVSLLTIQILTFKFLAPGQLKKELLKGSFQSLNHPTDSVFVRDFYVSSCATNMDVYSSHNLIDNEEALKEKLKVKFIQFQAKEDFSWDNPDEKKFKLVYHTWTQSQDYWTLYSFFSVVQTEELIVDKKYFYQKETNQRWILFFWMQSFERLQSMEI